MAGEVTPVNRTEIGAVRILKEPRSCERAHCQRVIDHFRCPSDCLEFSLAHDLPFVSKYFQFGPDVTCYGRVAQPVKPLDSESARYDALSDTFIRDGSVHLPFDPDEIIGNLQLERYVEGREKNGILRSAYYHLRPLTTISMRRQIQRFHARNWRNSKFPQWPLDTTVERTCETLLLLSMEAKGVTKVPFIWFWPRGAASCVTMTHDVEGKKGVDFCHKLMDIDDSFGVKASFQIVPERRYVVASHLIDTIRSRGFEVNVQDLNHDGRLFEKKQEFVRRAASVNRYAREYKAKGFRAGVLYRNPDWYESLDFSFDMSMPNVAHLDPQRGGCCTVMPYFIGKILEIPVTTTQDYTLFHVLNENSIDLWKTQLDLILKKNGLASFIIHPDYIIEKEPKSLYEELLSHLNDLRSRNDIWFAVPGEIDSWWRIRNQLRVERSGESWHIVGEGAEFATLAYAKTTDGELVYEFATSIESSVAGPQ